VRTLSAGQRRRTALARIVLSQAPLWLLDEPLNALDATAQAALRTALQAHLAAGGLVIAATHVELGIPGPQRLDLRGGTPAERAA
jgi:heme exporter protein A